jgi:hypothetical protein
MGRNRTYSSLCRNEDWKAYGFKDGAAYYYSKERCGKMDDFIASKMEALIFSTYFSASIEISKRKTVLKEYFNAVLLVKCVRFKSTKKFFSKELFFTLI